MTLAVWARTIGVKIWFWLEINFNSMTCGMKRLQRCEIDWKIGTRLGSLYRDE